MFKRNRKEREPFENIQFTVLDFPYDCVREFHELVKEFEKYEKSDNLKAVYQAVDEMKHTGRWEYCIAKSEKSFDERLRDLNESSSRR